MFSFVFTRDVDADAIAIFKIKLFEKKNMFTKNKKETKKKLLK